MGRLKNAWPEFAKIQKKEILDYHAVTHPERILTKYSLPYY